MSVKELLQIEIEKLPDILVPEVYNYVMNLESKSDNFENIKFAQKLSETAFAKVWDNDEDSIYDSL